MGTENTEWTQIKSEFISGATLKSLAEKYSISFSTLKSRHARENWSNLRNKTKIKTQEKMTTEIANKQTRETLNAIEIIDDTILHLTQSLPDAIVTSKEGLAKAISELFKVRGTYTGETNKDKQDTNSSGLTASMAYRVAIEYMEAKDREEAKRKKQNLVI